MNYSLRCLTQNWTVQRSISKSVACSNSYESYRVSPDDISLLGACEWSQQEIAEAVHITALFACFNRVANAFGLPSQHLLDLGPNLAHTKENA
jgi:alkylhydroperoxidase family enzyme